MYTKFTPEKKYWIVLYFWKKLDCRCKPSHIKNIDPDHFTGEFYSVCQKDIISVLSKYSINHSVRPAFPIYQIRKCYYKNRAWQMMAYLKYASWFYILKSIRLFIERFKINLCLLFNKVKKGGNNNNMMISIDAKWHLAKFNTHLFLKLLAN